MSAQRARRRGEFGWYVVNPSTGIIVAGPFEQEADALEERDDREQPENGPPAGLIVVQPGWDL